MCVGDGDPENKNQEVITSRSLFFIKENQRMKTIICLQRPKKISSNLFVTLVEFSGLIVESHRISGYDEMQSLGIAIAFADRRILDFSDEYSIEWDGGALF